MFQKFSIAKLLYTLLTIFLVGFLSLELFTYFQAKKVLVKGPIYTQIIQGKDLIADILPPPEYIIETYLNVLQLTKETNPQKIDSILLSFKRLEGDFVDRHEFWTKELESNELNKELLVGSYTPAMEFFTILKKDFIPAVQAKNSKLIDELAFGKLKELYDMHRAKIDSIVEKYNMQNEKVEKEAASIINSTLMTLVIMAIVFFAVFTTVFILILKNVLKNQKVTLNALDEATRSYNLVHTTPSPTMMCAPDGKLLYLNLKAIETFKKLQAYLPISVDKMLGENVSIFHKNPALQAKIISDPRNLPHKAIIHLGPEKIELRISAAVDENGKYLGAAVAWSLVTEKLSLIEDLIKASEELATSASHVLLVSSNLSASAEETSAQANTASVASEEVNSGVQTVTNNMDEMVSAIKEITKTTNEAATMTNEAMNITKKTNQIITKLGDSSQDIGNVIKVISSIAQQTNLLALNATIEAARAGEAGKGFAVVANEVKELANQTARATNEITLKIETIQADSKSAVNAISEITLAIEKVNGYTSNIAAAVEEQAATTNEVTRVVSEAATGVQQISENMNQVSQAAGNTGKNAGETQTAAKELNELSGRLRGYVTRLET